MPNLRGFGMVAVVAGVLALPAIALADDAMPAGLKGDMMMWFKDAESKLTQLAEAMPEGKYAWRPGKGVRSVGEVFMHVAGANFGIPSFMGVTPPEGFNLQNWEKSLTKKADIQKALKDSFAHMEQAFMSTSDEDMEKMVEPFGIKMTERSAYLLILTHAHEHLGQSIAYARTNNVVPPWSVKQAEMKEETDKAKEKK
jgi:uncharacterized damage-inducible protein DinB